MRLAVTGLGCHTAAGSTPAELWRACLETPPKPKLRTFVGGFAGSPSIDLPFHAAPAVDGSRHPLLADGLRRATRNGAFALSAALDAAGDDFQRLRGDERCAVIWGSGSSTIEPIEASYVQVIAKGRTRISPLTIPSSMASSPASMIAMALGAEGPSFAVASACASSAHAVAVAMQMIRSGIVDRAVAGGSEALGDLGAALSWQSTGVLAKERCRPFDPDRDGIVLGEGAAALMLERVDEAVRPGATVRAWVDDARFRTGGNDVLSPDIRTITALIDEVLDRDVADRSLLAVNAHATGTVVGDEIELQVLRRAAERRGRELLLSATKPVTGHMLSAAGAVEAVIGVMALEHGVLPCAASVEEVDWWRSLAPVSVPDLRRLHSNSFGFGGMNCVLTLAKA